MSGRVQCNLPNASNWRFDLFIDSARVAALEAAGSPNQFLDALAAALDDALANGAIQFAREVAYGTPTDFRAVIQFGVPVPLFDWFFNARTGYRAHFRADYQCGLSFNSAIVSAIAHGIGAKLPESVSGWDADFDRDTTSAVSIPKDFILRSLRPSLAKIWMCMKRIEVQGRFEMLPLGIGASILVGAESSWREIFRDPESAWLEVKGAFLGADEPYQPKDPVGRARHLAAFGEA